MLYFTLEVFRHLANQNRGHIRAMLKLLYFKFTELGSILLSACSKL